MAITTPNFLILNFNKQFHFAKNCMILSTLVTSQLHFEMCAGLYGHPVYRDTWVMQYHGKAT